MYRNYSYYFKLFKWTVCHLLFFWGANNIGAPAWEKGDLNPYIFRYVLLRHTWLPVSTLSPWKALAFSFAEGFPITDVMGIGTHVPIIPPSMPTELAYLVGAFIPTLWENANLKWSLAESNRRRFSANESWYLFTKTPVTFRGTYMCPLLHNMRHRRHGKKGTWTPMPCY